MVAEQQLVVGAIIVDSRANPRRVLAARRTQANAWKGRWEFPGGKVEPGESAEVALLREVQEELNVTIILGQELAPGETWPISDELELRLFWAEIFVGTPTTGDSHDELRWLYAEDLWSVNWQDADLAALPAVRARMTEEPEPVSPEEIARRSGEAMWASDRASRWLGMELIDVGPGTATMQLELTEDMVNGHDIGHGGITFTLADSAFAFACNSHNRVTVAASGAIIFRRPTKLGDILLAKAIERDRDERGGYCDVTVTVDGDVVAEFVGRSREIGGTNF